MKTSILSLFVASSFALEQFGQKDAEGAWISCDAETDCSASDKVNAVGSVCMSRFLKYIPNLKDPDYLAAVVADPELGKDFQFKFINRCSTSAQKDTFLSLNLQQDSATGILAQYNHIPYQAPEPTTTQPTTETETTDSGSTDTPTETESTPEETDTEKKPAVKQQLYKSCGEGDDVSCFDWFGSTGAKSNTCCWRAELVTIPATYADTEMETSATNLLTSYAENGMPSKEGETIHYCLNNWMLMYPNAKIPSDFTWTQEHTGLTWKGHCNTAQALKWGAVAFASAAYMLN